MYADQRRCQLSVATGPDAVIAVDQVIQLGILTGITVNCRCLIIRVQPNRRRTTIDRLVWRLSLPGLLVVKRLALAVLVGYSQINVKLLTEVPPQCWPVSWVAVTNTLVRPRFIVR